MTMRSAAQVLVDQLVANGVTHAFCVPGESFLPVLDALRDSPIEVVICRQEGGAAMMAEAIGKATGRPGVCLVTRGPGATNAAHGIHIAQQDSTPMIMFVGLIERRMRERRGQNADEARRLPRHDPKVRERPAEHPAAEPGDPDAGEQRRGAEDRPAQALSIVSDQRRGRFRDGRKIDHLREFGHAGAFTSG